ncbi:DHA2 family efflux MFS transporter permease subunit [Actinomadura sp. HBU206391]|uniref:DHA2 family efflux MFS transporter permease subunit n=1 Tax=Actinomadura sp. HBU206391 TaxID=2731692 RepID=UPI001C9C2C2E|nr:DHA2 family efflux MFS transporter permease subunit [Actinomadura sp. HBU206391]
MLRTDLGASLSHLEWTINAYNLALACLILTGSSLGDRFGRRRMYVIGLGVFTLASAAAALSGSVEALIVARVVQGAGAAVVLSLTLTLISDVFPAEKRGAVIGMWGGVSGLGVAAGPLVGGAIIEGISWQWIFWINMPIGLVLLPLSARLLRESRGPRPQLDITGLGLIGLGMFALTWAPVRAPAIGWDSAEVIGALLIGVLLVAAFLGWERRATHPMLPLRYFRLRGFSTADGMVFCQFLSLLGALFLITQLFQIGLGHSPLEAGLRILPWTGMPMLVAPLAGALADRFGNRPFMVLGLFLQAAGLAWVAAVVEPGTGYGELVGGLIVAGIGIAMCFPTVANAVVSSVPLDDTGLPWGTNNALREVGGVFGIAIVAAVFAGNGGAHRPRSSTGSNRRCGSRPPWRQRAWRPGCSPHHIHAASPRPPRSPHRPRCQRGERDDHALGEHRTGDRREPRLRPGHRPRALRGRRGRRRRRGRSRRRVPAPRRPQARHPGAQRRSGAGVGTTPRAHLGDLRPALGGRRPARLPLDPVRRLLRPLSPGSVVVTMSSGAALHGSPLSGGYAGAKAAIRFLTAYAAAEARRSGLGIRFVSVLPGLTPATELGLDAAAAYAAREGVDVQTFLEARGPALTLEQVGKAVVDLVTDTGHHHDAYLLGPSGLSVVE